VAPLAPELKPDAVVEKKPEPGLSEKTTPEVPAVPAKLEPAKKPEPTDPLDRLAAKKKPEVKKAEEPKKADEPAAGGDLEKSAEEKKQYRWGELKKAAEEDLPKAIQERDAAVAEREKLAKEIADMKVVVEERDRLKQESEDLRTRLYVHDVRELPQYKENRLEIDEAKAQFKKAGEVHKFQAGALADALEIADPTERAAKVDEVFESAHVPVGSTNRARLANLVEDAVARMSYEAHLERHQKAALEAHKLQESQRTEAQKAKDGEVYSLAAKQAFDRLKGSIPALADKSFADRVGSVPRITDQAPHIQAAAAYALEFLPDLLEKHEGEVAGLQAQVEEKDGKIADLEKIVAKYAGAGPSVKLNGDTKVDVKPRDFMEELEVAQRAGVPIV
jgi:hypothetical protein